ncbi:hypothetical protein L9G16_22805, partial [Shewanella sp. A25]|nr:hypothetical protein [Shewanella shenzhenensis]
VAKETAAELAAAYDTLRAVEHRIQMLADEQTHRLPENDAERRRVAALSGFSGLQWLDAAVTLILKPVNARYGEMFAEEEPLS